MQIINQDILQIEYGIIGHQVNCQGKMAAGLAGEIARKWPVAKEQYLQSLQEDAGRDRLPILGSCATGRVGGTDSKPLMVAHLFSQNRYGRKKQHTNYLALGQALHSLWHSGYNRDLTIYLPYGLGCGLGGGDWEQVLSLIERECPGATICKI